jgi:phospholipid/cholesterol/gamma-HCH transport system permease protein
VAVSDQVTPAPAGRAPVPRAPIGLERTGDELASFGAAVEFGATTFRGIWSGRILQYLNEVLRQASTLVTGSLLVVLGLVFALGLEIGIESSYTAQSVGAPAVAGAIAALADLREIIPYAFGYMMAAKVSTGYVAEIGTMRITEEIDALEVMGMDSHVYLCSTRLLGMWLVLPFIYMISIAVAFIGSYIAVVLQVATTSSGGYFELFWKFQTPADYLFSGIKGMVMATFVVLVGCFYGYRVRGGPADVGRATAKAMIINLVGVHFIGILGSQLFWGGSPRLPIGG